jgi:hypothetical protein
MVSTTAVAIAVLAGPTAAPAATYPPGFSEQIVFSGHVNPTAVRFASDGRVFVAEKSGIVKVYDSLSDTQPDTFADLRTQVHNFWTADYWGWRSTPTSRPRRTCTCFTPTTRRSVARRRAGGVPARRRTHARTHPGRRPTVAS